MIDNIIESLRRAEYNENPFTNVWLCSEAADEIERLRTIIFNFYFEERKYQDQINDRVDPEFTIPQSWKDAYRAFEKEAYDIESGY